MSSFGWNGCCVLGGGVAVRPQNRRRQLTRTGHRHTDAQRGVLAPATRLDDVGRGAGRRDHRERVREKTFAGWRRQKEPPRGSHELSYLHHREKRLQMAKLHEDQITHRDERSSGA